MLLMMWVSHTPHDCMNKNKGFSLMILIRLFLGDSILCVFILQTEVSCRNAQPPGVIQQESKGSSEACWAAVTLQTLLHVAVLQVWGL